MKRTSTLAAATSPNGAIAPRRWGMVAGVAVSLILHALLIFGWRAAWIPPTRAAQPETLTVWLRPIPPPVARLLPPSTPPPPRKTVKPAEREAGTAVATTSPPPTEAQTVTLPATAQAKPPNQPARPVPRFNMDEALKTARAMADEPDPTRVGTVAEQLDRHPLYPKSTESKLAREIDSAKRPDCKDGVPGGLLAPLFLMMDKKDSGCKW